MLASKVQGKPLAKVEISKPAEVVDIAEALRKSLANLKKPASSDQQLRKTEPVARKERQVRRQCAALARSKA